MVKNLMLRVADKAVQYKNRDSIHAESGICQQDCRVYTASVKQLNGKFARSLNKNIIAMEKLHFKTTINATPEKVWKVLWDDATYRQWTKAFSETSHAVTDWKQGSKVLFLDGNGQGMVSRIAELRPNEYMSFEHLGEISNGVEDTTSERVKGWAGARENYTLKKVDGKTELHVDMDINDEFKEMFETMWPKALVNLKEISEQ